MSTKAPKSVLTDWNIVRGAILVSFMKLHPRVQARNPVMFVVYIGSILTTLIWGQALVTPTGEPPGFVLSVSIWLWFTVLFANFAEAVAEGQGKAQADSLRRQRQQVTANKVYDREKMITAPTPADDLRLNDEVIVRAGEIIPADGEVVQGVASVDESAITGESAPVIRESGGDRSAVTGGTRVVSDWLVIRVTTQPGDSFLDRMIAMVEGAKRQKTPNEIALAILLAALTIIFLLVTATLLPYSQYSVEVAGQGRAITVTVLVALLVCLIPTTIGGLLSAIGIAGMNRLSRTNVIAMSGRAVEAAGDVDVLLLDKTGTITLGNRQATRFIPAEDVSERELADAAQLASLADETPEGRSIVVLAKQQFGLRGREIEQIKAHFVPFSAKTRMSGVDLDESDAPVGGGASDLLTSRRITAPVIPAQASRSASQTLQPDSESIGPVEATELQSPPNQTRQDETSTSGRSGGNGDGRTRATSQADLASSRAPARTEIRKGAAEAIEAYVRIKGGTMPPAVRATVAEIGKHGGTPLVVASGRQVLGVIQLKDIVKGGIRERFSELRRMGIKTVMITGDNPLTAAAIAAEAGVDDFLAEATPEAKLSLIREYQRGGRLVAMTGDGTNDAPALAQADVAVAMNTGTQAAKEAGNMVDLDSNPTKLIEIVNIDKQLLMTRGALTTFSIANDVAKYFAIIPAAFASTYPALKTLDVMRLATPTSAIMSAVIFNALIIIALIPLALRGVKYRPVGAAQLLRDNLLIYGLGGLVVPFIGIKLIDVILTGTHLV